MRMATWLPRLAPNADRECSIPTAQPRRGSDQGRMTGGTPGAPPAPGRIHSVVEVPAGGGGGATAERAGEAGEQGGGAGELVLSAPVRLKKLCGVQKAQATMGSHCRKVRIQREELPLQLKRHRRNQGVNSGSCYAATAARIGDLRCAGVMSVACEFERKSAHEVREASILLLCAHAGEKLLIDDTWNDNRPILRHEAAKGLNRLRLRSSVAAAPEGQGENRGVEDDHRAFRARRWSYRESKSMVPKWSSVFKRLRR